MFIWSYHEAKTNPIWVNAMEKKLLAIEHNETSELTLLPGGHTAITS